MTDQLSKKEFYQYKVEDINFREPKNELPNPYYGRYLSPHSHQLFVRNFVSPNTDTKSALFMQGTGCHGYGTPIMLYSGQTKPVQDVDGDDLLLGDDGTPRKVLSTISGYGKLFMIVPDHDDEPFVVNEDHILVLGRQDATGRTTQRLDIKLTMYMSNEKSIIEDGWTHFKADPPAIWRGMTLEHRRKRVQEWLNNGRYENGRVKLESDPSPHMIAILRSIGCDFQHGYVVGYGLSDIGFANPMAADHSFTVKPLGSGAYYGFELDGNNRYALGCFTVTHNTGKTLAAIAAAHEFIKSYRVLYNSTAVKLTGKYAQVELDKQTPTVFVLGFDGTKTAFVRDLLKYPEFGFITPAEKDEMIRLQKVANLGFEDDIKRLKEYTSAIKRRITNKSKGGFYKFYGYQEFVNRLFTGQSSLVDVETETISRIKAGEDIRLDQVMAEYIKNGRLQVNMNLLARFENSLLICDELHNTYNMNMKNNYGVAIQYVLDVVPSLRFIGLTATPFNNSPTEVVEVINYLNRGQQKYQKKDLFRDGRNLLPGKLEEIGRVLAGKVSFLQDSNPKYFPRREFLGVTNKLAHPVSDGYQEIDEIPYLKFTECPMSRLHQLTVNKLMSGELKVDTSTSAPDNEDEEIELMPTADKYAAYPNSHHKIPTDGYSIYDCVFPNPDTEEYGLFRSVETRQKINAASNEWRELKGIHIRRSGNSGTIISGDFLRRDRVGEYSTKCLKVLELLDDIISQSKGSPAHVQKVMIQNDRVKMSGVLLIQELLKANGYLDEYSDPVEGTKCCVCGAPMRDHIMAQSTMSTISPVPGSHVFRPARFVIAHSDLDKPVMEQSINRFNSPENANGQNYMILVGSKIIKESYEIKDVQNLIIFTFPVAFPIMIQVLGRVFRRSSHASLVPQQRRIKVYILLSTMNAEHPMIDSVSPEQYRYCDKVQNYIPIQMIEREMARNAIDADINRDIIMPPDLKKQYFSLGEAAGPQPRLGMLYFEPARTVTYMPETPWLSTFNAYGYNWEEIANVAWIIKRLFIHQPVWRYDDLAQTIRNPPISVEFNPRLIEESSIIVALQSLLSDTMEISRDFNSDLEIAQSIMNYEDKFVLIRGKQHKICKVGEYFVAFPMSDNTNIPVGSYITDVETYLRRPNIVKSISINVAEYVSMARTELNHGSRRNDFISKYSRIKYEPLDYKSDDLQWHNMIKEYTVDFQTAMIEEAIKGICSGCAIRKNEWTSLKAVYESIISLYDEIGMLIFVSELRKYKDISRQINTDGLSEDSPIAYVGTKSIRIYDHTSDKWVEVNKIAMNRHNIYRDNDVIVGYVEQYNGEMKFKLRKPSQLVEKVRDQRFLERGIVCSTKSKEELLNISARIGIAKSVEKGSLKMGTICDLIYRKLLFEEIRERERRSKVKWFYGFWDDAPKKQSKNE